MRSGAERSGSTIFAPMVIEIVEGNGDKYRMIFKTENLKMIFGSYDVSISSKGVSHFKNKSKNLQYWITTEAGSKFEKSK